jgi:hypothetical protein
VRAMGLRRMTIPHGVVRVLSVAVGGALAFGVPSAKAVEDGQTTVRSQAAAEDGPTTLRDAVAMMAQHFGFTVIGANRLGASPTSWPAEDLPPEAMLASLLKDYGYIVLLKPEAGPAGRRDPETVLIVGANQAPAVVSVKPLAPQGAVAAARPVEIGVAAVASPVEQHRPSWAPKPSTVVRALTKLASTSGQSLTGDQTAVSAAPSPNPADSAAAMAALTRSAQAGLGALVTGLRQACPNPAAC